MSPSPFNYFDKIYCINLDVRTDRWATISAELQSLGIDSMVTRWSGVVRDNPWVGVNEAKREVIQDAKDNSYDKILILEDDAHFEDGAEANLQAAIDQLPADWDMLYLGAYLIWDTEDEIGSRDGWAAYSDNLIKVDGGQTCLLHGLCLRSSVYDDILNHLNPLSDLERIYYEDIEKIDLWLAAHYTQQVDTYVAVPMIATQLSGDSDTVGYFEIDQLGNPIYEHFAGTGSPSSP